MATGSIAKEEEVPEQGTIRTEKAPGHWLLARMGKKVLRPGGRELTQKLVDALDIGPNEDLVEFAPGLGITAQMTLEKGPASYIGIEQNATAARSAERQLPKGYANVLVGNADATPLEDASCDKLYGEAMLTMQSDRNKERIVREAHRVLRKGGLYGIHELGMTPDVYGERKRKVQKDLARSIKVSAKPLNQKEWTELLEGEGFRIKCVMSAPMHLLETRRLIDDEGFFRTLAIGARILARPKVLKRVQNMRRCFNRYEDELQAYAIVGEKR
jgi:SAM-dependent methyltransferase